MKKTSTLKRLDSLLSKLFTTFKNLDQFLERFLNSIEISAIDLKNFEKSKNEHFFSIVEIENYLKEKINLLINNTEEEALPQFQLYSGENERNMCENNTKNNFFLIKNLTSH